MTLQQQHQPPPPPSSHPVSPLISSSLPPPLPLPLPPSLVSFASSTTMTTTNVVSVLDDRHDYFHPQQQQQQQRHRWNGMVQRHYYWWSVLYEELWDSTDNLFRGRIAYLLLLGPIVVLGDTFNVLDKSICFALSGLALIPCAERLSYLTEQIAEHTNGTISALFNATFGNAPELLISVAALRVGYYRVIQLTMLGSMITNMIFVFGVSCIIGGLRYQTQTIRTISGNVTIGMLIMSTAGSLIPATLVLSGQFIDVLPSSAASNIVEGGTVPVVRQLLKRTIATETPTQEEITLSRVNASVLILLYLCYIIFQLGSHKDEFDDVIERRTTSRPNIFCRKLFSSLFLRTNNNNNNSNSNANTGSTNHPSADTTIPFDIGDCLASPVVSPRGLRKKFSDHKLIVQPPLHRTTSGTYDQNDDDNYSVEMEDMALLGQNNLYQDDSFLAEGNYTGGQQQQQQYDLSERHRRRRRNAQQPVRSGSNSSSNHNNKNNETFDLMMTNGGTGSHTKMINLSKSFDSATDDHITVDMSHRSTGMNSIHEVPIRHGPVLSFRISVIWLFIITLCVSAISDILVDTIDEFAFQMNLSQVFTSMIIIPFFSNVAEQVSAFIFAYRNEMDLVVGVTIGSAIQIATFVLPGSVLIGYVLDRSMTLYFHSYETVCLLLCTLIVAAILQGGTTNWLVGAMLVGVYIMFAAGIWFHEIENLSVDTEELIDAVH